MGDRQIARLKFVNSMLPITQSSTCRCESSFPVEKKHIVSSTNSNHTPKSPLRQQNSIYSNRINVEHNYNYYQRCIVIINCFHIRSAIIKNIICCQPKLSKSIIHVTLRNTNEIQNKENSDTTMEIRNLMAINQITASVLTNLEMGSNYKHLLLL